MSATDLMKKYLEILNEQNASYQSLQDAGPDYGAGDTKIYYVKSGFARDFMMGYEWLKTRFPEMLTMLKKTHVLVGTLAETNPEKVFQMMQGDQWSPKGEAKNLIASLGLSHTSMSVGDIVVVGGKTLMADRWGFVDIGTGEEV